MTNGLTIRETGRIMPRGLYEITRMFYGKCRDGIYTDESVRDNAIA